MDATSVDLTRSADLIVRRLLAEFGIGLNPLSRRNGDFPEEKKARGDVHAALGDNLFYGGNIQSAVHIDMVMYRPTVWLDQRVIVADG